MNYVLATGAAEPDTEFTSLRLLARHIVDCRDRIGAGRDIRLGRAEVARDQLPDGIAISVRISDGATAGELIGYAFMPTNYAFKDMRSRLLDAIAEAAGARVQLQLKAA